MTLTRRRVSPKVRSIRLECRNLRGAVAERRVAEALRGRATERDPAAGQEHHGEPHARPTDRPRRWFAEDHDPGRDER